LFVFFSMLVCGRAEAQFSARPTQGLGEDFHVELGYMFWSPTPELLIGSDAFNIVGSQTIDFVQEFALENERFREFRATVKPGRKHKLRFSYVPAKYEKSAQIQRTITFNGRSFPVSAIVDANVDWKLWRYGYEWDFVSGSHGLFGVIAELKYNKVSAALSSAATSVTATADATAAVPTIGVIGRVYPHKTFSITGEFTGFKIPDGWGENFDAKFYDLDIYATLNFGRAVGVQGGYRSVIAQYLVDQDSGDLKLKGMYFGGLVRF
jgi:hypothetical protein